MKPAERLRKAVEDARALNIELSQKAESENRGFTADEEKALDDALSVARRIKGEVTTSKALDEMLGGVGDDEDPAATPVERAQAQAKSIGAQFVESAEYKHARESGLFRKARFDMPLVEAKATITATQVGDGYRDVRLPGVQELGFAALTVADLMPNTQIGGSTISYLVETTFNNNAATVLPGGTKPESDLAVDLVTEPLSKIAHHMGVHDEALEDADFLRGLIDARLTLGIRQEEEDQLVNGNGTAPNVSGILDRTGLTTAMAVTTETVADTIFLQITAVEAASLLTVDAVVMNPTDWAPLQIAKNGSDDYYGGGPFTAPGVTGLWGRRVVVTPNIAAGTALVGAFRSAAQVFRRGGIQLAATNSHASEFTSNITRIRAEERLGLAVFRPAAFGTVTGV